MIGFFNGFWDEISFWNSNTEITLTIDDTIKINRIMAEEGADVYVPECAVEC